MSRRGSSAVALVESAAELNFLLAQRVKSQTENQNTELAVLESLLGGDNTSMQQFCFTDHIIAHLRSQSSAVANAALMC